MLVEYSQKAIVRYNKMRHANGGIDTLYAFALSDSGKIYDGVNYEPKIAHAGYSTSKVVKFYKGKW